MSSAELGLSVISCKDANIYLKHLIALINLKVNNIPKQKILG